MIFARACCTRCYTYSAVARSRSMFGGVRRCAYGPGPRAPPARLPVYSRSPAGAYAFSCCGLVLPNLRSHHFLRAHTARYKTLPSQTTKKHETQNCADTLRHTQAQRHYCVVMCAVVRAPPMCTARAIPHSGAHAEGTEGAGIARAYRITRIASAPRGDGPQSAYLANSSYASSAGS